MQEKLRALRIRTLIFGAFAVLFSGVLIQEAVNQKTPTTLPQVLTIAAALLLVAYLAGQLIVNQLVSYAISLMEGFKRAAEDADAQAKEERLQKLREILSERGIGVTPVDYVSPMYLTADEARNPEAGNLIIGIDAENLSPETVASLKRGVEESYRGDTHDLGSFASLEQGIRDSYSAGHAGEGNLTKEVPEEAFPNLAALGTETGRIDSSRPNRCGGSAVSDKNLYGG